MPLWNEFWIAKKEEMRPSDAACHAQSREQMLIWHHENRENFTWVGSVGGDGNGEAGRPAPFDPLKERDRGVETKTRPKTNRPPRFKVLLYNDDYTPMEFVVQILEKVFMKSPSAATQLMLQIHKGGMGVGGVYVLEVAETKSATVLRMAEERGYPLRSGVEKE